jgi:hypothetical protein
MRRMTMRITMKMIMMKTKKMMKRKTTGEDHPGARAEALGAGAGDLHPCRKRKFAA